MTPVTTAAARDVVLRPVSAADETDLRAVHAQTHCEQLIASVPDAVMVASLARMQYDAQQTQYRAAYPDSVDQLITVSGEVAGRCWTDLSRSALRILDIAVLPAFRRRGVATAVVTLQLRRAAATGVPVALSVWSGNDTARRLYAGLGFASTADDNSDGYLTMTCRPGRLT